MRTCNMFVHKLLCTMLLSFSILMLFATHSEAAANKTESVYIQVYQEGQTAKAVKSIFVGYFDKGAYLSQDDVQKAFEKVYPASDYTNDKTFYGDGGWNQYKKKGSGDVWKFDTRKINGWTNLHTVVYPVKTVTIQVYANGDTSNKIGSVYVGKYKAGKCIPEADIATAFSKNYSGYENFGKYYSDGGWNYYKQGKTYYPWDFATAKVNGYTNLHTMAYAKQTVKYYLSDEDRKGGTKYAYASAVGYKGLVLKNTATDPQKEGYTFNYWRKEGQGMNYFTSNQKVNGWTNLVASFTPNQYKLTLRGHGGSCVVDGTRYQIYDMPITYDAAIDMPKFEMNGYTQLGWALDSQGVQMVELGDVWKFTKDTTLYAIWEPNEYTFTLYGNGGTINGENTVTIPAKMTHTYEDIFAAANLTVEREGYELVGWFIGNDASKPTTANLKLTNQYRTPNNINFAAVWKEVEPVTVEETSEPETATVEEASEPETEAVIETTQENKVSDEPQEEAEDNSEETLTEVSDTEQ